MKNDQDFTQGPILSKLIKFMLPVMAALLLQSFYSAVDLAIVGRFSSTEAVAGVSMGGQVVGFMTYIIAGMATAVTVILGRLIGEKKLNEAGNYVGTSIIYFTIVTVFITAILLLLAGPVLRLINMPESAMSEGLIYTRICAAGYIFVTAYNLLGGIFRGLGDSKTPLMAVLIACIVNIIGDLVLVWLLDMSAAGAAIATIFAQAVSVVISLIVTLKRGIPFKISRRSFAFSGKRIWHFTKIAFPLAINEMVVGISFMVITAILNTMGVVQSAAVGVTGKLVNFIMLFTGAFMQSLAAFVSQNIGARRLDRAKKALAQGIMISIAFCAVMFFFDFIHAEWLTAIFTKDARVVEEAASFLKSYSIDTFLSAVMFCIVGFFNGCGKTTVSLIIGAIGVIIRIPAAFILSRTADVSMFVVGLSTPISTIAQLIFCVIYLISIRKKLEQQFGNVNAEESILT